MAAPALAVVILVRGKDRAIRRRHPWIFSGAIGAVRGSPQPGDVVVVEDAHGEVLVVDWGIAKALASGLAEPQGDQAMPSGSLNATIAGSAMGSLHYMPPEQAVGALDRIDARSDIYALGATLQEMLTHQRPRTGAGAEALLELARAGKLTPLDDVAPTLHPDLAAIIRRAAAPAPEHRYPTCAALSADLRAYLEGRAVSALGPQ